MTAYYNEIDPYAAQWIRNLIAAGHIAAGDVDERSIEDVKPDELMGYTQCHFFAGVGVWSHALRQAGWSDDRQVWTGSCPCQPFSTAGKGAGFDDERHLWPHFQWLIQQCQPAVVFGEQVASKTTEPWIDLVHADMEAMGYSFGCVPFPAAGVGAPHIRDRAYWVANSESERKRRESGIQRSTTDGQIRDDLYITERTGEVFSGLDDTLSDGRRARRHDDAEHDGKQLDADGDVIGMANTNSDKHGEAGRNSTGDSQTVQGVDWAKKPRAGMLGGAGDSLRWMADSEIMRRIEGGVTATRARHGDTPDTDGGFGRPGPTNGLWTDVDWLFCRDGKWRPVESGTFPLAHGAPSRVGRLRANWDTPAGKEGFGRRAGRLKGYGNAINAYQAQIFIESFMSYPSTAPPSASKP